MHGSLQHIDCGKMQLDEFLSCLKVFFILNGGFLLHHSDVSRRDLEAEEVPRACIHPPSSQVCPGEVLVMQTPWLHCRKTSVPLTPPQSSAPSFAGDHLPWAQARQIPQKSTTPLFIFRAIITYLLSFGHIFMNLCTLLNRAQREKSSARSRVKFA